MIYNNQPTVFQRGKFQKNLRILSDLLLYHRQNNKSNCNFWNTRYMLLSESINANFRGFENCTSFQLVLTKILKLFCYIIRMQIFSNIPMQSYSDVRPIGSSSSYFQVSMYRIVAIVKDVGLSELILMPCGQKVHMIYITWFKISQK